MLLRVPPPEFILSRVVAVVAVSDFVLLSFFLYAVLV